jgi:hypothetical protein
VSSPICLNTPTLIRILIVGVHLPFGLLINFA